MALDYITAYIAGLDNSLLTAVSVFIDNELAFGALMLLVLFAGERRPEKIKKIAIALLLAFVISYTAKGMFKIERPCLGAAEQKIPCNDSYSFPSTHTAAAFTLALAFLNKRSYPAYLLFAIFVAFTRIYLLAHTFVDVSGGIIVAGVSYYLVDLKNGNWLSQNKNGEEYEGKGAG